MELGILTPEEGLKAIESGRLPTPEESELSQEKYRQLRDQGYYQPLIGGGAAPSGGAGRPAGTTGIPQTTKNVKPIGTSQAELEKYSVSKIKENLVKAQKLEDEVSSKLRELHKIKKMSNQQKEVAAQITNIIIANENPENWNDKISDYISNPVDSNETAVKEVQEIAYNHQLDSYISSILRHSKI